MLSRQAKRNRPDGLGRFLKRTPSIPRLRPHKIHRLSAHYGRTIYAVEIEGDLRAVFYVDRDTIVTVDIGTHAVYKP